MIQRLPSGLVAAATLLAAGALISACSHAAGLVPGGSSLTAASRSAHPSASHRRVQWFGRNLPWPEGMTKGPDGNIWFTEYYAEQIARMTPSGVIKQFDVPGLNGSAQGITAGPDGNLWIAEDAGNAIGRLTTAGVLTNFQINGPNPSPRNVAVGPDGNIWFTEFYDGYLGRITTSGTITRFLIGNTAFPWDVLAAPDGDIWFTDESADVIGRFDPVNLKFLPSIKLSADFNPWALTIGPDRDVWVTGRASGKIGTVVHGKVSEFTIPGKSGSYPDSIRTGPDGNLWFTESLTGRIGRFNPAAKHFLSNIILSNKDIPTTIILGPDGNMWFTDPSYTGSHDRIGRISLKR